ncbi:MAG: hypothetical protein EBU49_07530 [Proteobacteria bacterium]|nr:hypothetical protein [Pseudomonadota bacterium]
MPVITAQKESESARGTVKLRNFLTRYLETRNFLGTPFAGSATGNSLLSVLVSIGIAGIVIAMSAVAYRNMTFERRLIQSKNSYSEVDGALKNIVITNLRAKIAAGDCSNGIVLFDNIGTMTVEATNSMTLKTTTSALAKKLEPLREAAGRCAAPVMPGPGGNTFRFCLKMTPGVGARKGAPDSFTGSKDTFAEIQATMMDFTTGQPVTCAQFNASPRKAGFILTTGLHWVSSSDVGPVPNSNIGFTYVPGT